jgi:hypothetical protein
MQQTLNRLIEEDSERRNRMAYGGPGQYPQQPPQQGYPQQGPNPTQEYPPTQR